MGACASVFPKAMKDDAGAAPLPEQPKEEGTTVEVAAEVKADKEVKVEEEEKKAEDGGDEGKVEDEKTQSLGSLLNEKSEAPKESDEKASEAETVVPLTEESKPAEEVPVAVASDVATPVVAEPEKKEESTAETVADVPKEEKKTEEK